jgi:hypothetical protein
VPATELSGLLQFKGRSQMKTQETATSTDTANLDDNESSDNLEADDESVVQRMQTGDNQSHKSDKSKCPTIPGDFFLNNNARCKKFLNGCLAKCTKATKDYSTFAKNCGYVFCCGDNNHDKGVEGRCERHLQEKVTKKVKKLSKSSKSSKSSDSNVKRVVVERVCNEMRMLYNKHFKKNTKKSKKAKKSLLLQDMSANLIRRASEQDGLIKTAFMVDTIDDKCPTC